MSPKPSGAGTFARQLIRELQLAMDHRSAPWV